MPVSRTDMPSHPKSMIYGFIGTETGLEKFRRFTRILTGPVMTDMRVYDYKNWPHFPGFEAAYECKFPDTPAFTHTLQEERVSREVKDYDAHKRASRLVDMYLEGFDIAAKRDENLGVVFCIVPDVIWKYCRPLSKVEEGTGQRVSAKERRLRRAGKDLFGSYDPDDYLRSVDFRRQLKARAMAYDRNLNRQPPEGECFVKGPSVRWMRMLTASQHPHRVGFPEVS